VKALKTFARGLGDWLMYVGLAAAMLGAAVAVVVYGFKALGWLVESTFRMFEHYGFFVGISCVVAALAVVIGTVFWCTSRCDIPPLPYEPDEESR
jgi:hypothetical protein